MKNGLVWLAAAGSALALLSGGCQTTPEIPTGALSSVESSLAVKYIQPHGGLSGDKDEIMSARLQRDGESKENADRFMSELRSDLKIPDTLLDLKSDRTFTLTSGRSVTKGRWTGSAQTVVLVFDDDGKNQTPFRGPAQESFSVQSDGSLRPTGGGSPFLPSALVESMAKKASASTPEPEKAPSETPVSPGR
jgi:hypothetical protein